jgi:hypothetical protein
VKVSEWLRQYQLTGAVPTAPVGEEMLAFWSGWLMGRANPINRIEISSEDTLNTAITAAEFIETHAKG